jgi:multiple sugar transport system permease protein
MKYDAAATPKGSREDRYLGILLTVPALLILGLTILYPLATIVLYSFQEIGLAPVANPAWVGLDNYSGAIKQGSFAGSVLTSTLVSVTSVILTLVIGLAIAVLLDGEFPGRRLARSLIVLPWAMPTFAAAFAWRWMLDFNYGSVNHFLLDVGLSPIAFLSTNATAVMTGIAVYVWKGLPWAVIVFLAALQSVPHELREAARVDGATPRWEFRHVALPGVRFAVQIVGVLLFVWNFNWFDMMWLLTRGGPGTATRILPIEIYRQAFSSFNLGQASAIAVMVMAVLGLFAAIVFKMTREDESL